MSAFALLVLLAAQAGPASQPASQPAMGPAGRASDVSAELTIIMELGENAVHVQENWFLRNPAGKSVPASELAIVSPAGAKFLRLDEQNAGGFKAREDSTVLESTRPLGPEGTDVTSGYILDAKGSSITFDRAVPFSLRSARLIIPDFDGLTLSTSHPTNRRTRDLNGQRFAVYDLTAIPAGTTLPITLDGLPSQNAWPRRVALVAVFGIVAWMAWALKTRAVPGSSESVQLSPLSSRARRDQIVKAIEVLERDFREQKISEKKYQRRKDELMSELAGALRELEIAAHGERGAAADA
jgi:hypothetical protein